LRHQSYLQGIGAGSATNAVTDPGELGKLRFELCHLWPKDVLTATQNLENPLLNSVGNTGILGLQIDKAHWIGCQNSIPRRNKTEKIDLKF
jgi:hypothetical protein